MAWKSHKISFPVTWPLKVMLVPFGGWESDTQRRQTERVQKLCEAGVIVYELLTGRKKYRGWCSFACNFPVPLLRHPVRERRHIRIVFEVSVGIHDMCCNVQSHVPPCIGNRNWNYGDLRWISSKIAQLNLKSQEDDVRLSQYAVGHCEVIANISLVFFITTKYRPS